MTTNGRKNYKRQGNPAQVLGLLLRIIKRGEAVHDGKCPLYPFRLGTDPYRTKGELSPEQREQQCKTLALARLSKSNSQMKSENSLSEGTYIPGQNSEEKPIETEVKA